MGIEYREDVSGEIISIDGKTLRGCKGKGITPIHMVSAWASENQIVLGQLAIEEKSNEITAVPLLIDALDIEGCVITADAMSCQKEITKKIDGKKTDYVLGLKKNQETLYNETVEYFAGVEKECQFYPKVDTCKTCDAGHGRIEQRTYTLVTDPDLLIRFPEWTSLRSVGKVHCVVEKGGVVTCEDRYYISLLTEIAVESYFVKRYARYY